MNNNTLKIPDLSQLDDERLIVLADKQLAVLSATPAGSLARYRDRGELKPVEPGANCYRVADVRAFCSRQIEAKANELATALRRQNPNMADDELHELATRTARQIVQKLRSDNDNV